MMATPINVFFMGKGGVGKSTSAALNAVFLAQKGFKTILVSMDPAHNQSDILQRRLGDRAVRFTSTFSAIEIDQERWIKTYLKDVQGHIGRTYAYLTAFNLDRYFKVIRHSPGLEEYALTLACTHIRKTHGDCDYLVFDMPPTALSLKFFHLPTLSLIWIEQLLNLRRDIIQKRDLITKIKLLDKEYERDKVLNKIQGLQSDFQGLKDLFANENQTHMHLVLNPDLLSLAESIRIFKGLQDIDIRVHRIVYNKTAPDSSCAQIDREFGGIPRINFPLSPTPLIGMDSLQTFLQQNSEIVEKQLEVCYQQDIS